MTIFHFILIWLGIGIFLTRRFQYPHLILSFIVLFIISSYRDLSVGTDTYNYLSYFLHLSYGGIDSKELGWGTVNKAVVFFGGDFAYVLAVATLLVLLPVFYIAWKNKYNPALVVFSFYAMGFYTYSLNITRQIIAVAFVALSIYFLREDKRRLFLITTLLASTFHVLAVMALPLYFINNLPGDKRKLAILYLPTAIAAKTVALPVVYHLAPYLNKTSYLREGVELSGTGFLFVLYNLLFFWILYFIKKVDVTVKVFFVFLIFFVSINGLPYTNRLLMFFDVSLILLLPYFVYNNKLDSKLIQLLGMVFFLLIIFYIRFGGGDVLPYNNVLFN